MNCYWVEPVLAVEIDFAGWTDGDVLRQASFAGFEREVDAETVGRGSCQDVRPGVPKFSTTPATKDRHNKALQVDFASGLTSPKRVLFPSDAITKADVAAYLFRVGRWMLPHVQNRPLSLVRCPNGIEFETYFQRHPQAGIPSEIKRVDVGDEEPLLSIGDLAGTLAMAQISAIELHPWGCQIDNMEKPDRIIVDLDPDSGLPWPCLVDAAIVLRDHLAELRLQSFLKTSGGTGLHLVVPIRRRYSWTRVYEFSKHLAETMENQHPKLFVSTMSKAKRKGKIYIDYHRNRRGSTAVAAYSLRARRSAPVSTPITWEELPSTIPDQFTIKTIPERLRRLDTDPWSGILGLRQSLPTSHIASA